MALRADDEEAAEFRHALTELDIRTAACHVRRDRHGALLAGARDDLCFLLVELGVEHVVRDAILPEDGAEFLRLRDGGRADEDRLPLRVQRGDGTAYGLVLRALRLEDEVRVILADDRLVRRHDDNRQVVDLEELVLLRLGRARHACELVVHAEVVLEGDGRERLALALDLHALLCLDGLMQAVRVAAAFHEAARELIDDDDLAVAHDVVAVALHQRLGAQGSRKAVRELDVLRCVEVVDAEDLLDLRNGVVGRRDRLLLLVDRVVDAFLEARDGLGHDGIHVRRFGARARDDERRARLIDEDGVDLIDDGIVELALDHLLRIDDHVVAQVVEAELVVRAEGDIAAVRELALREVHVVHDEADRQSEVAVEAAHVLAVAAGQVVVDRDHVDTLARQGVEVDRQRRDERLAFARAHLCDPALMQAHAADELHIEMAHAEHAARALADDSKGFGQDIVKRLTIREALTELVRVSRQLVVCQSLHLRLQRIDLLDHLAIAGNLFIVIVT